MSATDLLFWNWVGTILATCGAALRFGQTAERVAAVAFLGAWIATLVIVAIRWPGYETGVEVVDLLLLAVLVVLALRSSRYWPIFAAGFHLLALMTHWARQLDPTVTKWTYVTAGIVWGYLPLIALAVGTWGAWRERRQLAKAGLSAFPEPTRR